MAMRRSCVPRATVLEAPRSTRWEKYSDPQCTAGCAIKSCSGKWHPCCVTKAAVPHTYAPKSAEFPSLAFRLEYYFGVDDDRACPRFGRLKAKMRYDHAFLYSCGSPITGIACKGSPCHPTYGNDIFRMCEAFGRPGATFALTLGDRMVANSGVIGKSRDVRTGCGAMLPLNTGRHWAPLGAERERKDDAHLMYSRWVFMRSALGRRNRTWADSWLARWLKPKVPWASKQKAIVWRGTTTGCCCNAETYRPPSAPCVRKDFVQALGRRHNVKFIGPVVQKRHEWVAENWTFGERLSVGKQLSYRYILSLEGNDVATDLKWKLAQNSVVVMPPPTRESWLMEGLLLPWVHYVPLYRPEDLESTLRWLDSHESACLRIIANAREWMRRVLQPADFTPLLQALLVSPPDLSIDASSRDFTER